MTFVILGLLLVLCVAGWVAVKGLRADIANVKRPVAMQSGVTRADLDDLADVVRGLGTEIAARADQMEATVRAALVVPVEYARAQERRENRPVRMGAELMQARLKKMGLR